jgi:hypothetical protein
MFVPVFVMKASAVPNIAQTLSVWSLNVCPSVCDEGLSRAKYCTNTERLVLHITMSFKRLYIM